MILPKKTKAFSSFRKGIFRLSAFLLSIYARLILNRVHYTTVNNFGYCVTLPLVIYGCVGSFNPETMLESQLYAFFLFVIILSDTFTAFIFLSFPLTKRFLYQHLGEEYIMRCVGERPSYPLTRLLGGALGALGLSLGAGTGHLAVESIVLNRNDEIGSLVFHQQNQQYQIELGGASAHTYGPIMERWQESTARTQEVHGIVYHNIREISSQFKLPLSGLVNLVKSLVSRED